MNTEVKKVIARAKKVQGQFQAVLKQQSWVEEAKKYADKQRKEVHKLLNGDVQKVKAFLEKERTELEKFQKQIPGEVQKLRSYVHGQRKELGKLLKNLRKAGVNVKFKPKVKVGPATKKRSAPKKRTSTATASS